MLVLIRVDSSIQIGIGHVMRCLTLANELRKRKAEVHFVCQDLQGNISALIEQEGFSVSLLPVFDNKTEPEQLIAHWKIDANQTISVISSKTIDWCVVDHYGIDSKWHRMLRKVANKIFVIDDIHNRFFDCDLLMDQTYGRKVEDYIPNVPSSCEFLLGSEYALLRPEFKALRANAMIRRESYKRIERILISLGGMDANNLTSIILDALAQISWENLPEIDIVLSSQAPYLEKIKKTASMHPLHVNVLSDVSNMAKLMLNADLAIGAGGSTCWERCCLGLPTLVAITAENQSIIVRNLEKANVIDVLEGSDSITSGSIRNSIIKTISSSARMIELSKNALTICDGNGAHLCATKMIEYST